MLLWNHRNVNIKSFLRTAFTKNGSIKCTEHFLLVRYSLRCSESESLSHDPMDYTVYGILQARILVWVAFPFSSRSSQPRDWTEVSCIAGRFFTSWATREDQELIIVIVKFINITESTTVGILYLWNVTQMWSHTISALI